MTDLGWYQRKQNQSFSNSRRQLAPNAHEFEEVTSSIQAQASLTEHEGIAYKVSNTRLMFNMNHGGDKMLLMGSTTIHPGFHIIGIPQLCEQGDSIGQTQRV